MGTVYRATDTRLGRSVAIKVLRAGNRLTEERRRRFLLEARAASSLNHPNIVTIYDIGQHETIDYIVMELVEGRTLDRVHYERVLSIDECSRIGHQLAHALERAHAAGIIHRDLKPANVMLTPDGLVKVLDFGLAKLAERAASASGGERTETVTEFVAPQTKDGATVGTPQYMAPEQAEGRSVDRRTDIFCFGLVMYELLTQRRPFQRSSPVTSLVALLQERPEPIRRQRSDVPEAIEAVILRCLEKNPDARFQSMREVRQELDPGTPSRSPSQVSGPSQIDLSATRRPSLAVRPFQALGMADGDYFTEGLTEEILVALAKLPGLRVAARNSSFSQALQSADHREVAARLRVDHVLEGTVRRSGERLRVTAQLVEAANGDVLWSERYDGSTADVFEIQDQIASAITQALEVRLVNPSSRATPTSSSARRRVSLRAHEAYLKGRYHCSRRSWESLRRGIEFFDSAISAEPEYALAFVGLADSYNLLGYYGERAPEAAFPQAKAAALRALQIDSRLAEAHASLGYEQTFYEWDWEAAAHSQELAIRLNPQYPSAHQWLGWVHFAAGEYDEALARIRTAFDLDPLSPIINVHLGLALTNAGQFDAAIRQFHQTADLLPDFALNYVGLGWALLRGDRPDDAIAPLERARTLSSSRFGLGFLGVAYARSGQTADAQALLAALTDQSQRQYISPAERAMIHGALGEADECFALLSEAVDRHAPDLVRFWFDPWVEPIRADPRFDAISARAGLR